MDKKEKTIIISSTIISISLIICSVIISFTLSNLSGVKSNSSQNTLSNNIVMNIDEAAQYLKIDKNDLLFIAKDKALGLKYLNVNGEYIFSKESLDTWLSSNQTDIIK